MSLSGHLAWPLSMKYQEAGELVGAAVAGKYKSFILTKNSVGTVKGAEWKKRIK